MPFKNMREGNTIAYQIGAFTLNIPARVLLEQFGVLPEDAEQLERQVRLLIMAEPQWHLDSTYNMSSKRRRNRLARIQHRSAAPCK